jgi:AraC-like DNA-binding protein
MLLIRSRKSGLRFRYLSLMMFSLALVLTEVFLDYSSYIMDIIQIDKFSFPVQFLIGPSLFLFVDSSLYPDSRKKPWIHFLVFGFFVLYFMLFYVQDSALKYNVHVDEYGLDLSKMAVDSHTNYDPLGIHPFFHVLVFIHLLVYGVFLGMAIRRKYRSSSKNFFNQGNFFINQYRNLFLFYVCAILIMAYLIFRYFWLGDFLFSLYLTAIIYLISLNISFRSLNQYFRNRQEVKYANSTLGEEEKVSIMNRIKQVAEDEEFYCQDGASLETISRKIKVSKHNVSQVINELMGQSFFEYLADLRINKAKSLLMDPNYQKLTIDEISFLVGYNSRSAFNRVFKNITGNTPTEFRRENQA